VSGMYERNLASLDPASRDCVANPKTPDISGEPSERGEAKAAAEEAGLTYASPDSAGVSRRRAGKGFTYRDPQGKRVTDKQTLARIRALAVPPAWKGVWICPDPNGHIQAMGFDDKGRRQYRYHAKFRAFRESVKYEHMLAFAEALPRLRARVAADMAGPGLGRPRVLATVVHLLETTMIRVGNREYARENQSFGLTTLEKGRHAEVEGARLKFHFKGKGGKVWNLDIRDRRVAKIVKTCQELPGQHLFQYLDADGTPHAVTSADVNAYLREITGEDVTAKDFRTWNGTVLAAMALLEIGAEPRKSFAKKNVTRAIERVSTRLGNTPAICRKCYCHPQVVAAYLDGGLSLEVGAETDDGQLRPEEAAVLAFLRAGVDLPTRSDPGR